MKAQNSKNNQNMQGDSTSNRAFENQRENQKQNGVSNAGPQRPFQTSSKDGVHQKKNH